MNSQNQLTKSYDGAVLEKVILQNDLSSLTPIERVTYVKNICDSLGLNPLTQPIQLLSFDGKMIPYVRKDGAEQLRNLHKVSIVEIKSENIGSLYIVKAYAEKPDGRRDCATGAASLSGLKGKELEKAVKKCETQAKRRVTLSICGLGFLDESEIEDLVPSNKPKHNYYQSRQDVVVKEVSQELLIDETIRIDALTVIKDSKNLKELETNWNLAKNYLKDDKEGLKIIAKEKDDLKLKFIKYDLNTGEVNNEETKND